MKTFLFLPFFLSFFLSSVLVQAASVSQVVSQQADLFREPGFTPDPNCYVAKKLTIDQGRAVGPFALLTGFVGGICELASPLDMRFFELVDRSIDSCGTVTYQGIGNQGHMIAIKDHRANRCESVLAAAVVVEISSNGRVLETLYSARAAAGLSPLAGSARF